MRFTREEIDRETGLPEAGRDETDEQNILAQSALGVDRSETETLTNSGLLFYLFAAHADSRLYRRASLST